jgi:hypothetical protein
MGNREVSAEDVMERRVVSVASTGPAFGDSEADVWRSSSSFCGVNYTGIGELERRTE